MFTGIIEVMGSIQKMKAVGNNIQFTIISNIADELVSGQSVAHNGVCLTVTDCNKDIYYVTAVEETLKNTCLSNWEVGDKINLERCMKANSRFDGHIVQGHIDTTATLLDIEEKAGSQLLSFLLDKEGPIIEKGSISIDGISLTCFNVHKKRFMVSIIPYTYTHTNLSTMCIGKKANIEFDLIGKYIYQKSIQ